MASLQIILFDIAETRCALRRHTVRELLPLPTLFRPPSTPRPVAGFFNLGGVAIPVVRLDVLFGMAETTSAPGLYRHLMLVDGRDAGKPIALLVDRVVDLVTVDDRGLSPVREADALNGCVEAEVEVGARLVHLLSLDKILFAEERDAIEELGKQAQGRLAEWTVTA